ncbi:hypothetical protein JG30_12760 (plasmid) [Bombilactobacillus mellifer]|uniref:Uncharacterized protein n=1 Tax=Bombilactobacillus mellifer TaxID=1218492 RepID=A0A0F4LMH1_9LACO|nr:hypothetical protein [Bombilactobacillus mellifer]KJY59503.1 hypothetical protein JG30_12760 [Bombilactobacillus mellifer]
MDENTSFILSRVTTFLIAIFMLALFAIFYNVGQLNNFQTQANDIIERSGGITADAQSKIDDLSKNVYRNHFTLRPNSSQDSQNQPYGHKIHYHISTSAGLISLFRKFPNYSSDKGLQIGTSYYTATSQIRHKSQSFNN